MKKSKFNNIIPKWLKYLILIILFVLFIIFIGDILPILIQIRDFIFKWYKFIYIPISSLLILYSLIDLYLLTKFGYMINKNENITINKNLPKFIKNYLLD